jgi:vitamin B12 transporter
MTLIDQEEIERCGKVETAEILRDVPGLTVCGSRASGAFSSVFVRGAEKSQTQVFVDGIPVNSPTAGDFDFSNLELFNIQTIEVLRGPQSTLWGSSAMGGVVSITTQKGEGPPRGDIFAEYGSFNTHREGFRASGGNKAADFSIAASNTMSDGINIAEGSKRENLAGVTLRDGSPARFLDEEDAYETQTVSGRAGFNFLEDGRVDFTVRSLEAEQELDQGWNLSVDDPTFVKAQSSQMFSVAASKTLLERWKPSFRVGLLLDDVENETEHGNDLCSRIQTQTLNLEVQNDVTITEFDVLTFGAAYNSEAGEVSGSYGEKSTSAYGLFLQDQLTLFDALHLAAGVRYDDHSTAGDKTTYRFTAAYLLEQSGTRPHASVGTGFRAPTLNSLFYTDPWGSRGNPHLKPEESFGFDLGVQQRMFADRLVADVTYFRNDFDNLIDWREVAPWVWEPRNVGKAVTQGVEHALKAKVLNNLTARATYTYLDTEDKEANRPLSRRPEHTVSVGATYAPAAKWTIDLNAVVVRDRIDLIGTTATDMDNFYKVDLTTAYRILDSLEAHLRFENLTDYDYEEIIGYQSPGIGVFGGLTLKF